MKNYARVADSIVGWGSSVGNWARMDNKAVIGEDVFIAVRRHAGPPRRMLPPGGGYGDDDDDVEGLLGCVWPPKATGC